MVQYLELLQHVLDKGKYKDDRTGTARIPFSERRPVLIFLTGFLV